MKLRLTALTTVLAWTALFAIEAGADPLTGRDILKFSQEPMLATKLPGPDGSAEIFNGHDELSTAWSFFDAANSQFLGYEGEFMADDFADEFVSPVVHVKWWGSYLRGRPDTATDGVQQFLISFEKDIPATTAGEFSRPGEPILNQVVRLDPDGVLTPGSGTYLEKIAHPTSVDGPIYEYNAELHLGKEFFQEPDTVYWLKIVALVDIEPGDDPFSPESDAIHWGWHNRDYTINDPLASIKPAVDPGEHIQGVLPTPAGVDIPIWHFQDDAVNGFVQVTPSEMGGLKMPDVVQDVNGPKFYQPPDDGPSLIGQYSKDLAFQLFTVPEPGSLFLALVGLLGIGHSRRRRS